MGRKFGGKHLNFTDGAAIPELRGSFKYDDEGTPATRTALVREGELVGRLHSRETAAKLGESPTGNSNYPAFFYMDLYFLGNYFVWCPYYFLFIFISFSTRQSYLK